MTVEKPFPLAILASASKRVESENTLSIFKIFREKMMNACKIL